MNIIDNMNQIKKLDRSNLYGSIVELPRQCLHAWEDAKDLTLPASYSKINNIIMAGMGGSGLGARIIESIFAQDLKYPLIRIHDYSLPQWANSKTLVICSSFSGTTEEIAAIAQQAQKQNCAWMSIGTGGTIIDLAKKHKRPFYQINPKYNPSKQPRMANGYSVIGQLIMAAKAGIIHFDKKNIDKLLPIMKKVIKENNLNIPTKSNPAKQVANKFFQKGVLFVTAKHLLGAIHTIKNQMNENSKNFSARFDIPELNHHLMEGLMHPDSNKKDLIFFFADSLLFPDRIKQRIQTTRDVIQKNKVPVVIWSPKSTSKLEQAFELIQFGSFVNFYLAMLYQIDPSPIKWVDYFKIKLGQPLGQWK